MFTARKLAPAEQWRSMLNMAVAFEGGFDWDKETAKAAEAREDPKEEHWAAFADGEAAPAASLIMNLFTARFDGHRVPMAGVGGVATLPAYRRGGAIRACMDAALNDLYGRGFVLSALYPFSSGFYRQFGYENGQVMHLLTLLLADLNKFPEAGGKVRQLLPGDSLEPLLMVYDRFYADCNLSVVRTVYDPNLDLKKALDEKRYVFVWEDENGVPGAFLIGGRDGATLNCRTDFSARNGLLFTDARSLCGLLRFVGTAFIANFEKLRFAVPDFVPIFSLIPEGSAMGCETFYNGMLRVVNVEAALGMCRCRGEGTVTLRVEDPLLPQNDGTFRVTFAPGAANRVERVAGEADAALPIGELSTLLLGVRGTEDIPFMPGMRVANPDAPLDGIFYKKPCHVLDLF